MPLLGEGSQDDGDFDQAGLGQFLSSQAQTASRAGRFVEGRRQPDPLDDLLVDGLSLGPIDLTNSDEQRECPPFPLAPPRPGQKLVAALRTMRGQMVGRGGAGARSMPSATSWLTAVYFGAVPPTSIPAEEANELRFLAMLLDSLLSGHLLDLGDNLVQRMKSLQLRQRDGDAVLSSALDPAPTHTAGLTSVEEELSAARKQVLKSKLVEARERLSQQH